MDKVIRYKFIDSDGAKSKEFIRKGNTPYKILQNIVYYDLSDAIVIMFDVTSQESFDDTARWLDSVRSLTQKEPEIFLVGSKVDKTSQRTIAKRLAMQYANQNGMHFKEVSVKDLNSANELLRKITSYVLNKRSASTSPVAEKKVLTQEKACIGCVIL